MPTKSLVKRTRKPRNPFRIKVEKELTHISSEQALSRHIYCIPGHYCDHPKDGWCKVGDYPTALELDEINLRLNPKQELISSLVDFSDSPKKIVRRVRIHTEDKVIETKKYFCMKCEDWHFEMFESYVEHMEIKRKRGQRLPSQLKPKVGAKFFCLKCNDWHQEPNVKYLTHIKYKRKKGRQPGWSPKK